MRNQDLAGRNWAARDEKSPAFSAFSVLGRDGREVVAPVLGTVWGQPCCWWPLSIPSCPVTLPSPPAPPSAGLKGLQGGGATSDRLCQSSFLGGPDSDTSSRVCSLPGAPPAHTPVSSAWSVGHSSQHQGAAPGLTTLSCPGEQWLWAAGPHPHPTEPPGLEAMAQERWWHVVLSRDRSHPSRGMKEAKL